MQSNISFGRHELNQIEIGITKEWIETNGLGAYAMGTIVGANTRKYHSLFTAVQYPPLKRTVMVNRVEESVLVHGQRFDCSCQEYPGNISPQGHLLLEKFSYEPYPKWIFSIGSCLRIEKSFFMRSGEGTSVLIYKHLFGPPAKLVLRPFISCRDHHSLIREDQRFNNAIKIEERQIRCAVAGLPELFIIAAGSPQASHEKIKIYGDGYWYKNLLYAHEEERESEHQEDLFSPGQIHVELAQGQRIAVVFTTQQQNIDMDAWIKQELFVRGKIFENLPVKGNFAQQCAVAADQFVIRTKNGTSIIGGYPWNENTIRESLISLPGICLATNRIEEARSILTQCSRLLHQGLLPNTFAEGEPDIAEYANMDDSLWFIYAVQKYLETTKDYEFVKEMKPHIEKILKSFREGIKIADPKNQCEILVDSDGLIRGSSQRWPLTWMNGKANDWLATPRKGKPVELQALWYNALQFYSEISLKMEGNDHEWGELAKKVRDNFNTLFWNSQNNSLYDVVDGNLREGSIRPSALFAISLPYEILAVENFKPVIETLCKNLYTSFGLRTLSPMEPHFHGIVAGDERNRIAATHNGAVLPFLIGPFLTAFFKAFGREQKNKEEAILFLQPFVNHLADAGLGTISEMFDGNSPHNPRGCIADSRAVAEILRVMKEEGLEL